MSSTITIKNCNNIASGEITINDCRLNILFGCNGTGKSTIARVIDLASKGKALSELAPYGRLSTTVSPSIEGLEPGVVAVFDDKYVSQYVFQPDSLIQNAFEILVRSEEFDNAKKNIDAAMAKVRSAVTERSEIICLQKQVGALCDTLKVTNSNSIAKRGGAKGILEGKGAYFNPPKELQTLKPFFEDSSSVAKWAAWRLQGFDLYGKKGLCPYCSAEDTEKTSTINSAFSGNFDKSSLETAAAIVSALEELFRQFI